MVFFLKLLKLQQNFIPNIYFFLNGKSFFYLQFSIFFRSFNVKQEKTTEKKYGPRIVVWYKNGYF